MKRLLPIILLALLIVSPSCRRGGSYLTSDGIVWNTSYHITYESEKNLDDSIRIILNEVGNSLSYFDSTSILSAVNLNRPVDIDRHFRTVFLKSREINKLTDGVFDPTITPLIDAWGFGKGHKATADTLRTDSLLKNVVGMQKASIKGRRIVKQNPGITFNFSAIAKGYGCDEVGRMFLRNGVRNFLVEIGGEICASGKSPSGDLWSIGIDRPSRENVIGHDIQEVVEMTDAGMATSGNYRNFHKRGGRFDGHTISTKTGRPVATDVASATVIAPSCMEADALATSFMAMGAGESKRLAEKHKIAVFLILTDSSVWESTAFKCRYPTHN